MYYGATTQEMLNDRLMCEWIVLIFIIVFATIYFISYLKDNYKIKIIKKTRPHCAINSKVKKLN